MPITNDYTIFIIGQRNVLKEKIKQISLEKLEKQKLVDIEKTIKEFLSTKDNKIDRNLLLDLVDNIQVNEQKEVFIHYKFNILNEEKAI